MGATIRKIDTVFSSGVIVITALLLAENRSIMGIVHTIFVVVYWGKDGFSIGSWGGVIRGRGSSGDGTGDSQKAGRKSELKLTNKPMILNPLLIFDHLKFYVVL